MRISDRSSDVCSSDLNAGGGLYIQHAVLDDAGAYGYGNVHFSAIAQIARCTAVDATTHGFQLVDNLHGAYLRSPRQGAGRKRSAQDVHITHADRRSVV